MIKLPITKLIELCNQVYIELEIQHETLLVNVNDLDKDLHDKDDIVINTCLNVDSLLSVISCYMFSSEASLLMLVDLLTIKVVGQTVITNRAYDSSDVLSNTDIQYQQYTDADFIMYSLPLHYFFQTLQENHYELPFSSCTYEKLVSNYVLIASLRERWKDYIPKWFKHEYLNNVISKLDEDLVTINNLRLSNVLKKDK